jgi:dnd system-associated protein 4
MFDDKQAWKKLSVRRDRKHEPLVEKLCSNKDGNKPVFTYIKDLMLFASMVGYSKNQRLAVGAENISIILETYASDQKDAFIYLLALITEKNGTILKDERLTEAIKIFEEYCNAGLQEIQLWLDENPADHDAIDTIVDKIYEQVIKNTKLQTSIENTNDIEVNF